MRTPGEAAPSLTAATAAATPYADALRRWAGLGVERLLVPGHGGQAAVPELTAYFGEDLLRLDIPPMVPGIDLRRRPLRGPA
jgi:hypothetical protein